ncbi:MAG TPA: hypothetical protein VE225_01935 [Rubrobacteraceae bacterium]|nr:hypothetical protein [Rubrobacteraceae bacterium]
MKISHVRGGKIVESWTVSYAPEPDATAGRVIAVGYHERSAKS